MNIILLESNQSTFWVFNWYYLSAVALSFTGVVFGIKNYLKKSKSNEKSENEIPLKIETQINPIISPVNNINVNVGKMENSDGIENQSKYDSSNREAKIESLKSKVRILFIDDDTKFNIVKILKDSRWKHTKSVVDIKSLDIPIVKDADIFFVDVNGIGKLLNCEHEGLDIALMLKQKYPNKKVVIYSANKNNNFHPAWDQCDFKLEKNALAYQFQSLVEQYSLELYG
jgi:hypothetical protein